MDGQGIPSRGAENHGAGLPDLLHAVRVEVEREPAGLAALGAASEALLLFPTSPEGRTDANCRAADLFFCLRQGWARDGTHLPAAWQAILTDMGMQLHDTFGAPEIARSFESTPEQLLSRLRNLLCPEA